MYMCMCIYTHTQPYNVLYAFMCVLGDGVNFSVVYVFTAKHVEYSRSVII